MSFKCNALMRKKLLGVGFSLLHFIEPYDLVLIEILLT